MIHATALFKTSLLPPRNSGGNVEHIAPFTLYAQIHPSPKATLIDAFVNRGGDQLPREYASGDFYLLSGWQGDIRFGGAGGNNKAETIKVPIVRNTDGSSITGPAFARFIDLPPGAKTLSLARSLTYGSNDLAPTPVDLDTRHAHLFTKQYEDIDGAVAGLNELSSSEWSWGDCDTVPFPDKPDPARVCLRYGADPTLMYELHYTAKDLLLNPHFVYDLGPAFHADDVSGVPVTEPPTIIGTTPSVLHTLDADGNEIGGIHNPLQQAPLVTYVGWNIVVSGFRNCRFCPLTGGYIPFAATEAERVAAHDSRPSIEERYSSHGDYVNRVRSMAKQMVSDRLLLQDDAENIVQ
jgi:hypothetical protein